MRGRPVFELRRVFSVWPAWIGSARARLPVAQHHDEHMLLSFGQLELGHRRAKPKACRVHDPANNAIGRDCPPYNHSGLPPYFSAMAQRPSWSCLRNSPARHPLRSAHFLKARPATACDTYSEAAGFIVSTILGEVDVFACPRSGFTQIVKRGTLHGR